MSAAQILSLVTGLIEDLNLGQYILAGMVLTMVAFFVRMFFQGR